MDRIDYGTTFYNAETLRLVSGAYLKHLPSSVGGLLTQGSSGCAIASAMMVQSNRLLKHLVVRKDGEHSHSSYSTGFCSCSLKYAIVDDFISTGKTARRLLEWARTSSITVSIIIVGHINGGIETIEDKLLNATCPVIEIEKLELDTPLDLVV